MFDAWAPTAGTSKTENSPLVAQTFSASNLQRTSFQAYPEAMLLMIQRTTSDWIGSLCDLHSKKLINLDRYLFM